MMMGNGRYRLQINEVVHLLASRLNQEVDKYVAWQPDPGAFAIDAFTVDLSDYPLTYCFPPFYIRQKIEQGQAEAVLVVPDWTIQFWHLTNQQSRTRCGAA